MRFPELPAWLRTRLIFAVIITAALAFGIRFNQLITESSANTPPDAQVIASSLGALEPAAGPPAEQLAQATEAPAETPASESQAAPAPQTDAPTAEAPATEWKDSSDNDLEYSAVNMQLFEDLAKRRTELESREKELATRAALLQAAERNLDQKYKELNDLRTEVKDLLQQQNDEETARIASLVKIYEGMKAKDAARIFDTLDMDVLLQVIGKMSERKSAPIIAAMNPERARSVTIMLAEQKALPTLDDGFFVQ